jgi:hypothetical protein
MKKQIFFTLICILLVINSAQSLIKSEIQELDLGKNTVYINLTDPMYVRDFLKFNPGIEVISYHEGVETVGFVNYFNGIGENFIVYPREYEIIMRENSTLIFPE